MSSTKSNIVQCKNEQNKKFFTKRAITFHKNVYVYNDLTTINEPVLSIQWEEHPKLAHWSIKLSNNKPSKPNHISEWKKPVGLMKFKMWNATHVRELEKLVRGKRGGGGREKERDEEWERRENWLAFFFVNPNRSVESRLVFFLVTRTQTRLGRRISGKPENVSTGPQQNAAPDERIVQIERKSEGYEMTTPDLVKTTLLIPGPETYSNSWVGKKTRS